MFDEKDYLAHNRNLWNQCATAHVASDFYDVPGFLAGRNSLTSIELNALGDIKGKSILHLQCHFGQDTISLSRLGAKATGIDLSNTAIKEARLLAAKAKTDTRFVESDVYALPNHLEGKFDIVFTSFGTIGWMPDLDRWAGVIRHFLKPGGRFVFAEFHPFVWMYDHDFTYLQYAYFNREVIVEEEKGSYASDDEEIQHSITWNHPISEVLTALLTAELHLNTFEEFDYSPHNSFKHTEEYEPGKFRIKHFGSHIPMVYALSAHL